MSLPPFVRNALLSSAPELGQDLVEYFLITALVAFVVIVILDQFTPGIAPLLQQLFGGGQASGIP